MKRKNFKKQTKDKPIGKTNAPTILLYGAGTKVIAIRNNNPPKAMDTPAKNPFNDINDIFLNIVTKLITNIL